jgi:adenylate cyclase
LRLIHEARGELPQAQQLAQQLLRLAQRESHHARLMRAYNALGATSLYLGEFAPARTYLDQGIALDTPPRDRSAGVRLSDPLQGDGVLAVSCRRHLALTLWYLGYPAQALERSREAIALAQVLAHPHSLAYALYFATQLHALRREAPAAQGQRTGGIAQMRQGMEAHRSMGAMQRPYDLALLAEVLAMTGQTIEARCLLDEALALTHRYGGHF